MISQVPKAEAKPTIKGSSRTRHLPYDQEERMVEGIRCWWWAAEATIDTVEITALGDTAKVFVTGETWRTPSVDGHNHASRPPTPGELLAAGARAFDRVRAAWS